MVKEKAMCVAFRQHPLLPLDDGCFADEHTASEQVYFTPIFLTAR
jgi:hypothetical protein